MRRPFDLGLSSLDEDGAAVGFADVFGSVTPWAIPQITTLTAFERTIRHRPNRASTPKTRRHSSPARRANQLRFATSPSSRWRLSRRNRARVKSNFAWPIKAIWVVQSSAQK